MRTSILTGLILLGLLLVPCTAAAQHVRGTLVEAETARALSGADAVLLDDFGRETARAVTDQSGSFTLTAPGQGGYWIRIEHAGYHTVESRPFFLGRGETMTVRLETRPEVARLEGVTVRATTRQNRNHAGFLERQRLGWGKYLGPEELDRRQAIDPAHLINGMAPGLTLDREGIPVLRTRDGRTCTPTYFIDGSRVPWAFIETVPASLIGGVEAYSNSIYVPAELRAAFSECGAIAFWTEMGLGL